MGSAKNEFMAIGNGLKKCVGVSLIVLLLLSGAFAWRLVAEAEKSQNMMTPRVFKEPGIFVDCPSSPNCVSTQESPKDDEHYLPPMKVASNPVEELVYAVENEPSIEILERGEFMLRATHTSSTFAFVDDFAFFYDSDAQLLHAYSASRVGYSDMGANRKRIETLFANLK